MAPLEGKKSSETTLPSIREGQLGRSRNMQRLPATLGAVRAFSSSPARSKKASFPRLDASDSIGRKSVKDLLTHIDSRSSLTGSTGGSMLGFTMSSTSDLGSSEDLFESEQLDNPSPLRAFSRGNSTQKGFAKARKEAIAKGLLQVHHDVSRSASPSPFDSDGEQSFMVGFNGKKKLPPAGKTIRVSPSDRGGLIHAVSNAEAGDKVLLLPGKHLVNGTIRLNKPIEIVGHQPEPKLGTAVGTPVSSSPPRSGIQTPKSGSATPTENFMKGNMKLQLSAALNNLSTQLLAPPAAVQSKSVSPIGTPRSGGQSGAVSPNTLASGGGGTKVTPVQVISLARKPLFLINAEELPEGSVHIRNVDMRLRKIHENSTSSSNINNESLPSGSQTNRSNRPSSAQSETGLADRPTLKRSASSSEFGSQSQLDVGAEVTQVEELGLIINGGAPLIENCHVGFPVVVSGNPVFRNCVISSKFGSGVTVKKTSHTLLDGCTIRQCFRHGVEIAYEPEDAVQRHRRVSLESNHKVTIDGCEIKDNNGDGVNVGLNCIAVLKSCRISGSGQSALRVMSEGNVKLKDCYLSTSTRAGVHATKKGHVQGYRCEVSGNLGSGVQGGQDSKIEFRKSMLCENTKHGIDITDKVVATFQKCKISSNGSYGANIVDLLKVKFTQCHFVGNMGCGILMPANHLGARGELDSDYPPPMGTSTHDPDTSLVAFMCVFQDNRLNNEITLASRTELDSETGMTKPWDSNGCISLAKINELKTSTIYDEEDIFNLFGRFNGIQALSKTKNKEANAISQEQFIHLFDGVTDEGVQFLKRVFSYFDIKNSGYIGFECLINALNVVHNPEKERVVQFFFKLCDVNRTGEIPATGPTWLTGDKILIDFLANVLQRFDNNGSGTITYQDIVDGDEADKETLYHLAKSITTDAVKMVQGRAWVQNTSELGEKMSQPLHQMQMAMSEDGPERVINCRLESRNIL